MKTPAGKECRFFYGDYYRGRTREECRLLGSATPPLRWRPELCKTCPVPEILLDNACQYMVFEPFLQRSLPFFKQQAGVRAFCNKTKLRDFDPHIGCGQCHPLPPEFIGEKP
jgi:hypothetical protein